MWKKVDFPLPDGPAMTTILGGLFLIDFRDRLRRRSSIPDSCPPGKAPAVSLDRRSHLAHAGGRDDHSSWLHLSPLPRMPGVRAPMADLESRPLPGSSAMRSGPRRSSRAGSA